MNPYLNLPNSGSQNRGDKSGENSSKAAGKSSIKLDESAFDKTEEMKDLLQRSAQSLRDKINQAKKLKIQDSFFSSESRSDESSYRDIPETSKNDGNSSSNVRLIQGNEPKKGKRVKRIDSTKQNSNNTNSNRNAGTGNSLQRMQSVKFKDSVQVNVGRRNLYQDNTADISANDLQMFNDSQSRAN